MKLRPGAPTARQSGWPATWTIGLERCALSTTGWTSLGFYGAIALIAGLAGGLLLAGAQQVDPGPFGGEYDEGIRLEQLLLISQGFRPFSEVFASQGPLLLGYFYGFYAALGEDLLAARSGSIAAYVVVLLAVVGIARHLGGTIPAIVAGLVIATSPVLRHFSQMALGEVVSIAPTLLSVWLVLRFRASGSRLALFGSAVLVAVGILLKPMAVLQLVLLGMLLLPGIGHWQFRTSWQLVLGWAGVTLLVVLTAIVAIGPDALGQPFLGYRQAALGLGPMGRSAWSPLANLRAAADPLRFDLPYLALGLAGAPYLWRQSRRTAMLLLAWIGAAIVLLSLYSPLAAKHVVYVLPPVAILAGLSVSAVLGQCATHRRWRSLPGLVPSLCALIWLGALLPAVVDLNWRLVAREELWLNPSSDFTDALRVITAVAGPDDYVLTDDQWLSFMSRRKVPPSLVDVSTTRIRSGLLTGEHVVTEAQRYRPAVVAFWADRLRRLRAVRIWVPRGYRIIRTYEEGRAVYVREDLLPRLTALQGAPMDRGAGVRFGTMLVLEHARLLPGRGASERYVELVWRASSDVTDPPKIQIQLRDAARRSVWKTRTSLIPEWQAAPWPGESALLQRHPIDVTDLPPGEYVVDVSVWVDKAKDPLRVSAASNARDLVDREQRAALLGRVYR